MTTDDPVRGGRWSDRPLFARDADITVYWPEVRPCYDNEQDDTWRWEDQ
jgi:hypothetical protein